MEISTDCEDRLFGIDPYKTEHDPPECANIGKVALAIICCSVGGFVLFCKKKKISAFNLPPVAQAEGDIPADQPPPLPPRPSKTQPPPLPPKPSKTQPPRAPQEMTQGQVDAAEQIFSSLANKDVFALLKNKPAYELLKKKIVDVHPFSLLIKMKTHISQILLREGMMFKVVKSNVRKEISEGFNKNKDNLLNYTQHFANGMNKNRWQIETFIKGQNWDPLIDYLFR